MHNLLIFSIVYKLHKSIFVALSQLILTFITTKTIGNPCSHENAKLVCSSNIVHKFYVSSANAKKQQRIEKPGYDISAMLTKFSGFLQQFLCKGFFLARYKSYTVWTSVLSNMSRHSARLHLFHDLP